MTTEANDTIERYVISGTGPYTFSWRIFDETDLAVTALSVGGVDPVALTVNTHYTVSGVNDEDGGSITLIGGAQTTYSGYTLDIRSNTPIEQPTSIKNQGTFAPVVHEKAFDRINRQLQDVYRQVKQCFRYPDNVTLDAVMTNRTSWLAKYLYVNSSGVIEPANTITGTVLSQSTFDALLPTTTAELPTTQLKYDTTAAETASGVTPVQHFYNYGVVERYQIYVDSTTDMSTGVQAALKMSQYVVARTAERRTYRCNSDLTFPAAHGLNLDFGGSTIDSYSTGKALSYQLVAGIYPLNCDIRGLSLVVRGGTARIGFEVRTSYSNYYGVNVACASDATGGAVAWKLVGDEAGGSGPYYNQFFGCHGNGTISTQLAWHLSGVAPGYRGPNANTWYGGRHYVNGGTAIRITGAGNKFFGPTIEGGTVTAFDFVAPAATKCDGNSVHGAYIESVTNAYVFDALSTNNKASGGYYTGITNLWTDANGTNEMDIPGFDKVFSNGIKFSAVSTSRYALDRYDEGSGAFSPTVTFATPGDVAVTYGGSNAGYATQFGNLVVAHYDVHLTNITHTTASGALRIGGAPAACAGVPGNGTAGFHSAVFNYPAGYTSMSAQIASGSSNIELTFNGDAAGGVTCDTTHIATGSALRLQFTIIYRR